LRPSHQNLGIAFDQKGELDAAILQLQEAVRLQPDNALGHYNLGVVFNQTGQTNAALRQYQEALRLKPDLAEARANLEPAQAAKPSAAGR